MELIPNLNGPLLSTSLAAGAISGSLASLLFLRITKKTKESSTIPIKTIAGFILLGIGGALLLPLHPATFWHNLVLITLLTLLLTASWEDVKNQIIPNTITLGGASLLITLSTIQWTQDPLNTSNPLKILLGAVSASAILTAIALGGKLVFGKKVTEFDPPEELEFLTATKSIRIGEETLLAELLFQEGNGKAEFFSPEGKRVATLLENGKSIPETLEKGQKINRITTPRDVLGWGDIKFMIGIGAVCGVSGSIFTITLGCALGAILALPLALQNSRIPFVPFLSSGCIIYLWQGNQILKLMGW